MKPISENSIELATVEMLQSQGWEYIHGLSIAPGGEYEERK